MPQPVAVSELSDEQLARRAGQGCAASFEELMRRFQVPVLHFLQHRGSRSEAEDLLQDTFVRAYENLHRYDSRWRFGTWLFTIARRVCINAHRKANPRTIPGVDDAAGGAREPLEALIEEDERRYLWQTARRVLSESEHAAVWLHYVEEMPLAEIARIVGRSRVAVKAILFRARRRLLPHLKRFEPQCAACAEPAALRQDGASWSVEMETRHA